VLTPVLFPCRYVTDLEEPSASCGDLDLTDAAVYDATTGLMTWDTSAGAEAPLEFSSPDSFGSCVVTDNVDVGVQSVEFYASVSWSTCGASELFG